MKAYPDTKCTYGYMCICDECLTSGEVPKHVDTSKPLACPPAVGKKQPCEICKRKFYLNGRT